jgi:hypothetical protein
MVATQGFGEQSLANTGETASTVLAARAKAEVEARYIMAMHRPRNWDVVRSRLLKEVERPGFAEKAWYQIKNRGAGFTIKFAEAALRNVANLEARSDIVFEDDNVVAMSVIVIDLETNVSVQIPVQVKKTVERKSLRRGEVELGRRTNSYGDLIYIRQATDDEIRPKINAEISKALRTGVLRLLPGDIQSDCEARINAIREGAVAADPDAYKKKIIDSFSKLKIGADDLERVLEHSLDTASEEELLMLRGMYSALKNGDATYTDFFNRVTDDGEVVSPLDALKQQLAEENAGSKQEEKA